MKAGPDDGTNTPPSGPDEDCEVAALLADKVSLQDRPLRVVAETENTRRRGERAAEDAGRYAVSNFAREMLAVANNLDQAIKVAEERDPDPDRPGSLIEGLTATQRSLTKILAKFGIQKTVSSGVAFDPPDA